MSTSLATPSASTKSRTPSAASATTKPPCTIDPKALISDKALLSGTHFITIKANAAIHPYVRLNASHGPIVIGEGCVIFETATLISSASEGLELEDHVTIGSGAEVLARRVGEGSEIGVKARVGEGLVVGQWARITAGEAVDGDVEDYGVVFAGGRRRGDGSLREDAGVRERRVKGVRGMREVAKRLVVDGRGK